MIKTCFSINRRQDCKHKLVVALYTKEDCFPIAFESEDELTRWFITLLQIQLAERIAEGDELKPIYGEHWHEARETSQRIFGRRASPLRPAKSRHRSYRTIGDADSWRVKRATQSRLQITCQIIKDAFVVPSARRMFGVLLLASQVIRARGVTRRFRPRDGSECACLRPRPEAHCNFSVLLPPRVPGPVFKYATPHAPHSHAHKRTHLKIVAWLLREDGSMETIDL